ncbi:MAG: winged helix-turn-helix domain-containing protein [Acidobacteriota bacterium]
MTTEWRIAGRRFAPELQTLDGAEGPVHLEPRTAALLLELAEHAGAVRTRDELLDAVWGDRFVGEAALTHCIWELRKAFGDDARKPHVIQTVPRRGYRLIATVAPPSERMLKVLLRVTAPGAASDESPSDQGLLVFDRPVEAVREALAIHRRAEATEDAAEALPPARCIVHMDDVASELATTGVEALEPELRRGLDALLEIALPGQTLVTRAAFDLARRAAGEDLEGLRWLAHGAYSLPGDDPPIELFEVGDERAPLRPPHDTDQVRRAAGDDTIVGWRPGPDVALPQRPNWRLIDKLGEGSFGEVWLTEHAKTKTRRVFKFCFEVGRLRALQREVTLFRVLKETLGNRDDIVRLIDWDFEQPPYFVEMEHTNAGSLRDWAASNGGIARVPLTQRLELVAQAAEALAAAHSVGVLHQDVKPSNLLVQVDASVERPGDDADESPGAPRIRLADFGIGRLLDHGSLDDAGITRLGFTGGGTTESSGSTSFGTRLYMAPEMLEGRAASTEADVFALGVVLYQVVVGDLERAVATGWERGIDDAVLCDDIAACVDVSPRRRPSAADLARRLRELENRRAERARRERERAQAERDRAELAAAQRRRRLWLRAALGGAAATVIVSLLALQALSARDAADRSRRQAQDLVRFMLGDLSESLGSVGRLDAMDGTLDEVLAYLDAAGDDPAQLADDDLAWRAEALRQVGQVRLQQGALDAAEAAFLDAAEASARLVTRDPDHRPWRAGDADSRFWLGFVHQRRGDLDAAAAAYDEHRTRYAELVALEPKKKAWRLELAAGHHNLGDLALARRDLETAREHFERCRSIFEALASETPSDDDLQRKLAGSWNRLGLVAQRLGALEQALASYRRDEEILQRLAGAAPDDVRLRERLAITESYLGGVHWMRGELDAAEEHFRVFVATYRGLVDQEPENAEWRRRLAFGLRRLGETLSARGETDEAERMLERAVSLLDTLDTEGSSAPRLVRRERAAALFAVAQTRLRAVGDVAQSSATLRSDARQLLQTAETLLIEPESARSSPSARTSIGRRSAALLASILILRGDLDAASVPSGAPVPDSARGLWRRAAAAIELHARPADAAGASPPSRDPEILAPYVTVLQRLERGDEAAPLQRHLEVAGYRSNTL